MIGGVLSTNTGGRRCRLTAGTRPQTDRRLTHRAQDHDSRPRRPGAHTSRSRWLRRLELRDELDGRRHGTGEERGVPRVAAHGHDDRFDRPGQRRRQPLRPRGRAAQRRLAHRRRLLVSNFNAKSNNQGTGTTIVQLTPAGKLSLFATISAKALPGSCPGGVGLTTALGILPGGYVVVGSLPTTNGQSATAKLGCLIVLNSTGKPLETIAGHEHPGPVGHDRGQRTARPRRCSSATCSTAARQTGVTHGRQLDGRADRPEPGDGQAPKVTGEQVVAERHPLARRQDGAGDRPDRRRARVQRHALRRRHAREPDHRDPRTR